MDKLDAINPPLEIDATLAVSQDVYTTETIDAIMADVTPHKWTKESVKRLKRLSRIMDNVHNEIADKVNSQRAAALAVFFREDDKYIPEHKQNNHFDLFMGISFPNSQSNPNAKLP